MKRRLLGLGEEVVDVAVEHHPADHLERDDLLGDQLGRIEHVEVEAVGGLLVERLDTEFPLREITIVDRLEQVAAMKVRIGAVDLHGFVPHHRDGAEHRAPVEFDEGGLALLIDQTEGVDAEAFDHAQRARDRAVGHHPGEHVHALRHQRGEIPERVMRGGGLRIAAVRLHLHRMDQVGKLDRVLDEKHRNVVADEIEIAFLGVEFHREAAHVARQVARAGAARHGGEAHEHFGLLFRVLQERRLGQPGQRLGRLKKAVRSRAARMHDTLGNALMIEMGDLLAQHKVFQQRGTARTALQRILVVRDRHTLVRGQQHVGLAGDLMRFAAMAGAHARAVGFGGAIRARCGGFLGHHSLH